MADINKDSKPLFSIFIPTWNNLPFLKLCVESIEKNSTYKHEILIHVNDGSDGTLDWVREKGYKHTHSKENIGVCYAMNSLRSIMTTDYVMYVNDDMYMCPDWDKYLYEEILRQPDKRWYLASTMIQPRPHPTRRLSVRVADFGTNPENFDEAGLLSSYKDLQAGDWHGAVLPPTIVHREIWDYVGGYSIEFSPGMGSDPDFNAKLYMSGVRTFKGLGKSMCYHFMSVSVNRIVQNNGFIQFLRKWGMTMRVFLGQVMKVDRPWDGKLQPNGRRIATEHFRSRLKKLITLNKDVHSNTIWDILDKEK